MTTFKQDVSGAEMKKTEAWRLTRRHVWLLFFLALFFRLVFGLLLPRDKVLEPVRDQEIYLALADNLAGGRGLIGPCIEPVDITKLPPIKKRRSIVEAAIQPGYFRGIVPHGQPTAFWEPVYPVFLGLFSRIGEARLIVIRIVQAVIGALMIFPLLFLAERLFKDSTTSIVAAVLLSVYPFYIYYTGIIMSETLYTFLLIFCLVGFYECLEKQTTTAALILGICSGLCFLTRTVMLGLVPIMLVFLLYESRDKKRGLILGLTVLAAFCVTLSPWVSRNYYHFDHIIMMPTKGGPTFWARNNPLFLAEELEGTSYSGINPADFDEEKLLRFPQFTTESEAERSDRLYQLVLSFIQDHPGTYLKLCLVRLRWLLSPLGSESTPIWQSLLSLLTYGLTLFLAMVGLLGNKNMWRDRNVIYLFSFLLYFILFHALINGDTRFRLPLDFMVLLLAAPVYGKLVTWSTRKVVSGRNSWSSLPSRRC